MSDSIFYKIDINRISAILGLETDDRPRAIFIARGHPGNKWYLDAKNQWVLRDEYAENIPEALIDMCNRLGWCLTIIYAGKPPHFDTEKRSYTDKHPGFVTEINFADIKYPLSKERAKTRELFEGRYDSLHSDSNFSDLFSYRGINFKDHMEQKLKTDIPNLSTNMSALYNLWSEVFSLLKPKLVMAGRLDVMPYIVSAARQQNIVSANIKLGIGQEMMFSFAIKNSSNEFEAATAPHITIVWGEAQKALIEKSYPDYPSHIVVSGRTRNDTFAKLPSKSVLAKVRKKLAIKPKDSVILFGGNHRTYFGMADNEQSGTACMSPLSIQKTLEALGDFAAARKNTHVIFKPHPADNIDMMQSICDDIGPPVRMLRPDAGFHNLDLLTISTIFVSSVSSMFTEALSVNCLPINLWLDDVNYLYERERRDVWSEMAYTIDSIEELGPACEKFFDHRKDRDKALDHYKSALPIYAGQFDGNNARRAVLGAFNYLDSLAKIPGFKKAARDFMRPQSL